MAAAVSAAPNSEAVIQAWKVHLPCRVRFGAKAQQEGRGPGPEQHTGILFDLQLTKKNKYEFKVSGWAGAAFSYIYSRVCVCVCVCQVLFANPLQGGCLEVFTGFQFNMTCYYNWDVEGRLAPTTRYVRDFVSQYTEVEVKDNQWGSMDQLFPKNVRDGGVITQQWTESLPLPNHNLQASVQPHAGRDTLERPHLWGRRGGSKATPNPKVKAKAKAKAKAKSKRKAAEDGSSDYDGSSAYNGSSDDHNNRGFSGVVMGPILVLAEDDPLKRRKTGEIAPLLLDGFDFDLLQPLLHQPQVLQQFGEEQPQVLQQFGEEQPQVLQQFGAEQPQVLQQFGAEHPQVLFGAEQYQFGMWGEDDSFLVGTAPPISSFNFGLEDQMEIGVF